MRKLIIGAAILFVQMSFGQVTKELGDFDTVKVFDKLSVKLVQSSENKIVLTIFQIVKNLVNCDT